MEKRKFSHNDEVYSVFGNKYFIVDQYDPKNNGLVICFRPTDEGMKKVYFQEHQIEKIPTAK